MTSNIGSDTSSLLLGDGTGGFGPAPDSPFSVGSSQPNSVAVGDFDGNGDLDLATANFGSKTVSVLLGDGAGGFVLAAGSPFAVGVAPSGIATGDFDGNLDLVTTNAGSRSVSLLLGRGEGRPARSRGRRDRPPANREPRR